MPDIGGVTARVNVNVEGANRAQREMQLVQQQAALMGEQLVQVRSETAGLIAEFNQAATAVQEMAGGMGNFQRITNSFAADLNTLERAAGQMAAEMGSLQRVLAEHGELTTDQANRLTELRGRYDDVIAVMAALRAEAKPWLDLQGELVDTGKKITASKQKEVAISRRMNRLYANQTREVRGTTRSMSRFARILNVLRHPRYLLSIEGMSFAFRELGEGMDSPLAKFRALPGFVKGSIGVFAGLAAILGGGVFLAFKAVNSETAKLVDQMNMLGSKLQLISGSSQVPAWMTDLADRVHATDVEIVALVTDLQLLLQGKGFTTGGSQGFSQELTQLAEGLAGRRPEAGFGGALSALQQFVLGSASALEAYGVESRGIQRVWEDVARAQGLSVDQLQAGQVAQAAAGFLTANYGDQLDEAAASFKEQIGFAERVKQILADMNAPTKEIEAGFDDVASALEGLLDKSSSIKEFWDNFRAWSLGVLADAARAVGYLANLLDTALTEVLQKYRNQPWVEGIQDMFNLGDVEKDLTAPLEALEAVRRRLQSEGRISIVDAAAAQVIESVNGELKLGTEFLRKYGSELMLTDTEMRDFLATLAHKNDQHPFLGAEEADVVSNLWREYAASVEGAEQANKDLDDSINPMVNEFLAAENAIISLNQAMNSQKQSAFGLIGSWKSLVESRAQLDQEMTPQNVFAFWQAYDQFQQQALQSTAEGLQRMRDDIEAMLSTGDINQSEAGLLYEILDSAASAAETARAKNQEVADAYGEVEAAGITAAQSLVSSTGGVITQMEVLEGQVYDVHAAIRSTPPMVVDIVMGGIPRITYSSGGGGSGGGSRSTAVNYAGSHAGDRARAAGVIVPVGSKPKTASQVGYDYAVRNGYITPEGDPVQPPKPTVTGSSGGFNFRDDPFYKPGGGGGGGGGRDDKATLAEIRRLVDEVNRAISIGIRGGIGIGTEGNVVPLDEATSLSQGGLQVGSIVLKGVWDFTDPAAKRKIITEIKDLLRQLEREQG